MSYCLSLFFLNSVISVDLKLEPIIVVFRRFVKYRQNGCDATWNLRFHVETILVYSLKAFNLLDFDEV